LAVDATRSSLHVVAWCERAVVPREFTELLEAPDQNDGFTENGCYLFRKPAGQWAFHVDDEPLQDDAARPSCWVWKPGFYAGEVTAELTSSEGRRAALFLLDVSPDASKLGRDEIEAMVRDLLAKEPSLVLGTEPATGQTGHLSGTEDPWLAFFRLRRYAPDFVRALEPIRSRPRRALRVRRDSVALHRVRRIDRQTVRSIVRGSSAALLTTDDHDPTVGWDTRLDVPSVEESLDSAANRAILAMIGAVLIRSRELRDRLQVAVDRERDSDTRTSLAARWPRRRQFMDLLISQLEQVARRLPFAAVERAEVTAAGLTAVTADSTYARAWGRGWRALRRGVDAAETPERIWRTPSWEIYERWCFIRIGTLLEENFPGWNWSRRTNPHCWEGSSGSRWAELRLQPTFGTSDTEAPHRWSLSRERAPDIVLTVRENDVSRFVVLDVKYRVSRQNVLDAMASAHIYQDSLRVGARRPEASLLIVPRTEGAAWLADPGFISAHRVGIHPLHLESSSTLPHIINELLD
jgi:hypothetical protein